MRRPAGLALVLLILGLQACGTPAQTGGASARPAGTDMESRMTVMTDEILAIEDRTQGLPVEVQSLKATVDQLERKMWDRQSKLAAELAVLKEEVIPVLTNRLDVLNRTLQQMHEEVDSVRVQLAQAWSAMRTTTSDRVATSGGDAAFEARLILLEESLARISNQIERVRVPLTKQPAAVSPNADAKP